MNLQLLQAALLFGAVFGTGTTLLHWKESKGLHHLRDFLYGFGVGVIVCGALHLLGYFEAP